MFYKLVIIFFRILFKIFFKVELHDFDKIPNGPLVVCSNHKSVIDPVLIAVLMDRPIHYLAKKELFDIPIFRNILTWVNALPIDRDNPSMSTIKNAINILKDKNILGIFIEGTRVKEFNIENANAGVGLISIRGGADILPIKIETTYKIFSKIEVYFRDIIKAEEYDKSKESYEQIAKDALISIYYGDKNAYKVSW